jgi:hypothetical protein
MIKEVGTMDRKEIMERIYNLEALESVGAKEIGMPFSVLRVPGGWLWLYPQFSCFVALNNEFKIKSPARAKVPNPVRKTAKKLQKQKAGRAKGK